MGTANKSNVTLRSDKASPLTREEMDGNFSELENVIDDSLTNEQRLDGNDAELENVNHRIDALVFESVADMKNASFLELGQKVRTLGYHSPGDGGGNDYEIVAAGTGTDDGGSYIDLSGSGLQAKGLFGNTISVKQFGAIGDNSTADASFRAAANYATLVENSNNKPPFIYVPRGDYGIETDMPEGMWWLDLGADIERLGGVPPTNELDTSRLKGKVVSFTGAYNQHQMLYVGDPNHSVKKYTGKGFSSEISSFSANGTGGLTGATNSKAGSGTTAIGITAVGLNDRDDGSTASVWGLYIEGIKAAEATGTTYCMESTIFNDAPVVKQSPYSVSEGGVGSTWNLFLTTGGIQGGSQVSEDTTGAIGIKGKGGSKYDRGIIVKNNSITTREIVAAPKSHRYSFYGLSSDQLTEKEVAHIAEASGNENGALRLSVLDFANDTEHGAFLSIQGITPLSSGYNLGSRGSCFEKGYINEVVPGGTASIWTSGRGSPEGVLEAPPGSLYTRTDGGAGTTLYVKESGGGNTGWVSK